MNRERPTFVGFCSTKPTCIIVSSTFFMMGNREFLHCLSLLPQGKSKTGMFQQLSKNAWNAIAQINYGVAPCPCSFTLGVPDHFTYPQETRTQLSYAQTSQAADSERNIQSWLLLWRWNKWQRIELSYYFSWFIAYYLLFISVYQAAVGIRSPQWSLQTKPLTISNKLWKDHDLTLQPVITYIYLCERLSASCLSSFTKRPVMDQKLNWNVTQALEKPFTTGIL
jgi:hypothetical protein